jgi:hypothetical protein
VLKTANSCFFVDQYAAHLKNKKLLSNTEVVFISTLCTSQFDLEGCSHDKWETAPSCLCDEAGFVYCSVVCSRNMEIDNNYCNQELLCEVWFLI